MADRIGRSPSPSGAHPERRGGAEAEAVVAAGSDGEVFICHAGLGTKGRVNGYFARAWIEPGRKTSGTNTEYRNLQGCSSAADELDERTRLSFGYRAKAPYRLKSVSIRQTEGPTVTVKRSEGVRVLMDEGDEVMVTFNWVRTKRR